MEFSVRGAREADIPFLAWAIQESMTPVTGKGVFDDALAQTETTPLVFHEAMLATGTCNWGQLDSFLLLEDAAGRAGGAAAAFSGAADDLRPLTASGFEAVSATLGWGKVIARDFWRQYLTFFGLFGKAPQLMHAADYVIEYVAIRPELRGQRLYGRLLQAHLERARGMGEPALSHSAVYGNAPIIRALERFGFQEVRRIGPEVYKHQFPGMIRFRYDIAERQD